MREPTLDPVRRPRLPRGRTLLRAGLVATFLLTAVAALFARDPAATCAPAPTAAPAPSVDASGRLAVPPGAVGVPVRLAEPAVLALVRPGDRVDLLAVGGATPTPAPSREPAPLARDALVLGVVGVDGAVLLALAPDRARAIVSLPDGTRFGVIVRPK
ncbi:flagellar biosynthesis protein FlgA [Phytohabitans sp. ZYX-F-186]|uniref:Flagellar biosynthesis protein FlgA n=1 Tax=Phytohabitans maris TaxID=3071409 RepID=A0ABU0ZIE3_9ACTN|nr:flagellar biosynthesis protein FlgA [Phytohabitans sp. ZYX-F-186]MDQ7906808.1 flagellar biosynthesis protein FlgA [Phytohabitans sp. ZYX-F-186]